MKIKLATLSKRVCKGIEGKRSLSMRNEDSAFENRGGPSYVHSVCRYYLLAAVVVILEMCLLRIVDRHVLFVSVRISNFTIV